MPNAGVVNTALVAVSLPIVVAPVPLGVMFIAPSAPSANTIVPALVPSLVDKVKSPVPLVVIVALALLSPTLTVSALRLTFPVPFGVRTISLFAPCAI